MKNLAILAVAALVALTASPALAGGHAGQNGLGLLYSDAPIGYFRGLSDEGTLHLGLGFDIPDTDDADNGEVKSQIAIAAAFLYELWGGDGWGFGLFPGLAFQTTSFEDVGTTSVDSATLIHVALHLGGHVDLASNVAVFFKHGVNIDIFDSGVSGADSQTDIGTSGWDLGDLGVAFFF